MSNQNHELVSAFHSLEKEKGIKKDTIINALKAALASAYKRNFHQAQNVEVDFGDDGSLKVYAVKKVVQDVKDPRLECSLKDALKRSHGYELGDKIRIEVTPRNFGRIAAQTAKQVVMQKISEAERQTIYDEYSKYQDELITGTVERQDYRFVYVNLGKVIAVMPRNSQIPSEEYRPHEDIQVYVTKVENASKGPQVYVSRTAPGLLKRLFEEEVPEIYDGTVEIVSIAREAGNRAKVAVRSTNKNIDPVGTTVGPRGERVQAIVNKLGGENMDIVQWDSDEATYIANALNPSEVDNVIFDPDNDHACTVIVPDNQLSLAIGKRGQNARLAAKLTGYKIDIEPESDQDEIIDKVNKVAADSEEASNDR
ncbi:MAG: transcription termination/antitermination protein NusA [Acetilactobacillus jinshanensis]